MKTFILQATTQLGFNGTIVEPGQTVAIVETRHAMDNVVSAIRTGRLKCIEKSDNAAEKSVAKARRK